MRVTVYTMHANVDGMDVTTVYGTREELAEAMIANHGDQQGTDYPHTTDNAGMDKLIEALQEEDFGLKIHWDEHIVEVPGEVEEWLSRKPEGVEGVTILVEPDPNVESRLEEFEIRQQVDDEGEATDKLDLELRHDPCGEHLCDVEHDDTLRVLLSVARSHTCPHPDTLAYEASEDAGLAEDEEGD